MKFKKLFIFILVILFKTGNVLSNENIFNVNNIEIIKKKNMNNQELAQLAIKYGFEELKKKILLDEDQKKLSKLNNSQIIDLMSYYQVVKKKDEITNIEKMNFNIFFDKKKLHDLFYKEGIFYSEIGNKEIYTLPIFKKDDQFYVYNKNFFYENWNEIHQDDQIEFILPLENIEIFQKINSNKNNFLSLSLNDFFQEYTNKNLALIFIEETNSKNERIFLKMKILGKNINKNLLIKKENLNKDEFNSKIIETVKKEIKKIVKTENLIDVRTPSFLNTKIRIDKKNNLAELNKRLKEIDTIENIFVQKFNNEHMFIKIKYLGRLDKIINQLNNEKIRLDLQGEEWSLKIL